MRGTLNRETKDVVVVEAVALFWMGYLMVSETTHVQLHARGVPVRSP